MSQIVYFNGQMCVESATLEEAEVKARDFLARAATQHKGSFEVPSGTTVNNPCEPNMFPILFRGHLAFDVSTQDQYEHGNERD